MSLISHSPRPYRRHAARVRRVVYIDEHGAAELQGLYAFYGPGVTESAIFRRALGHLAAHVAAIDHASDAATLADIERAQIVGVARPRVGASNG